MANKLPKGSYPQQMGKIVSQKISLEQSHSGPLPAPLDFQGYDQIVPGAAERILVMAEKEQAARHEREKAALEELSIYRKEQNQITKRGQWFAFLCVLLIVGLCTYLVVLGEADLAVDLGKWVIIGLAAVFLGYKLKGLFPQK